MKNITVDFKNPGFPSKPMHAVNNGPVFKFTEDQRITNIDHFRNAHIPYARTHDASFYWTNSVDIHLIFRDFSKDVNDPASYSFALTDDYMKTMIYAGVEPFFRLGSRIEHEPVKFGTLVPPDYQKWAEICEHIIAHYTEGWADGFHYKVTYWEIWNEPDGAKDDADPVDKKCWAGTAQQFFELFEVAAKHLKARFPNLKIGGPAVCVGVSEWNRRFLAYCRDHKVPMDFFSWHCYTGDPRKILSVERATRELINSYGYTETESILNEWNYVSGWTGDKWLYSLDTERNLKGSSFIAATVAASLYQPLDLLMYYDARPCAMNGLFVPFRPCSLLKGYFPLYFFGQLDQLGTAVPVDCEQDVLFAAAEKGKDGYAVMLTHYEDLDKADGIPVKLTLSGLDGEKPRKISYYFVDEEHDATLLREEILSGTTVSLYFDMPLFTTVLVKVTDVPSEEL